MAPHAIVFYAIPLVWMVIGACSSPPAPLPTPTITEEPALDRATCRPASNIPVRTMPWTVGSQVFTGWNLTAMDIDNPEFIRLSLEKDGTTTGVEIAFNDTGPNDWTTEHYRLMPTPGAEPPEALLSEIMAALRELETQADHHPFVTKREGVKDPYEGLPPCKE